MSKKIYFISTDASWQKYRLEVLSLFADRYGHEIEILTSDRLADYLGDTKHVRYKVFNSWLPSKLKVKFYPKALFYIYKNRPNYILSMSNVSGITEYMALLQSRLLKIPFIFWTHGYDHHYRKDTFFNRFRDSYTLFFLKRADHVITFSEKGRDYLIDKKIDKRYITVAPNSLDTNRWIEKSNGLDNQKERTSYGYSSSDTVLLFSGRLYKEKKLMIVLQVMKKLQQEYGNFSIYLHIVGDGDEFDRVSEYIDREEINNTIFHGEVFDEDEVSKIFSLADIFVMPSSIGLAIIHAFCFALPIITEESISHGPELQYLEEDNGYMLRENDLDQWAETILKLHSNRVLLKKMSDASLSVAQGRGSITNMIQQMEEAFNAS